MDLSSGSDTKNGNLIHLWDCHYGNNQKWILDSDGRIRSKENTSKCIEAGSNLDEKLKIWDCHDGDWQKFELTSDGKLRSKKNNRRFIGVAHGCGGVAKQRQLEMQNEYTGTTSMCAVQQQWL